LIKGARQIREGDERRTANARPGAATAG